MKILFIGDVMGRAGREAVEAYLPELQTKLMPDVVIMNGENAAHGRGITEKMCVQFYELGVDVITTGNHVWDQREILTYIMREPRLIRPANYPEGTPGNGLFLLEKDGKRVLVVNMMCRLFMDTLDDPFACMERILSDYRIGKNVDAIFVDLHGEATSEKMSFGHHFAGKISAVIGTHTHIPTADAHVMKGGTAYMSDAGMCGDYDSVIGVKKASAIHRFVKKTPGEHFVPASEHKMLCGALVTLRENTGLALKIEPVRVGDVLNETLPDA